MCSRRIVVKLECAYTRQQARGLLNMALRGDSFLQILRFYRSAWMGGRYGGGKTSFGVRVGIEFVERGWADHILCNFPCVVATDMMKISDLRRCFIILDEGGTWLKRKDWDDVAAFLRKRDLYLFVPSVIPPPVSARMVTMQRTWNFLGMGVPLWYYNMRLDYMRVKETYKLLWTNPQEVFGLYSTSNVVGDDGGLVTLVNAFFWADKKRGKDEQTDINEVLRKFDLIGYKTSPEYVPEGERVQDVEEIRRVSEDLYESTKDFEEAVSLSRRYRRRRRY